MTTKQELIEILNADRPVQRRSLVNFTAWEKHNELLFDLNQYEYRLAPKTTTYGRVSLYKSGYHRWALQRKTNGELFAGGLTWFTRREARQFRKDRKLFQYSVVKVFLDYHIGERRSDLFGLALMADRTKEFRSLAAMGRFSPGAEL